MALASIGSGWALAMLMLYAAVLIPSGIVPAFLSGAMAMVVIGSGVFLRDPLDRRSPMCVATGWMLGLIANRIFHFELASYITLALVGAALGLVGAIMLHYAENHMRPPCAICGDKSALRSKLEMAYQHKTPYVLIDYGDRICPTCEAKLLSSAHAQVINNIKARMDEFGPLPRDDGGGTT